MNISLRKFGLALALVTFFGISAPAQVRIATVDLEKVYNSYWKKREADSVLKDEQSKIMKKLDGLRDEFKSINESYQKLIDSASDAAISTEERDKRKGQADDKLKQMKQKQDEFTSEKSNAEVSLSERQKSVATRILTEIRSVVAARAKSGNYTVVLNAGSETSALASIVIYASGDTDITPDVIKDLNASAPAGNSSPDDTGTEKKPEKKK